MTQLEKRLEVLWKNQNPFVVYRLPKSKEIHIFFQEENQLHKTDDFSESGFVMTSFESLASYPFIPNSKSERFPKPEVQDFKSDPVVFPEDETRKSRFIELVKKAQSEIAQGHIKKVVISRSIDLKTEQNPSTLFLALENKYQDALTYLWHHPLVGTWLGATPEQFIEASSKSTLTMALAGTQIYTPNKNPHWSHKEKEEQALVTQQVLSDLKTLFKEEEIKYGNPQNKRAGNLVHLCTHFTLPQLTTTLKKLITALHPTPAVGGVPKKEAVDFIINNESYDRTFYTGFLGPIGNEKTSLFVNLRCAEWTAERVRLFVGAGITSSSDPESEWLETQRKSETLARIL